MEFECLVEFSASEEDSSQNHQLVELIIIYLGVSGGFFKLSSTASMSFGWMVSASEIGFC